MTSSSVPEPTEARHVMFLAPSAYRYGGVQTWLDQTIASLRRLGWRVTLGLVEGARFHDAARYEREHPGHDVVRMRCVTGTSEGRARAIVRGLESNQPDVLVIANVADGLEAARRFRSQGGRAELKTVYSIHGFLAGQIADVLSYADTVDRVVGTNRLTEAALRALLVEHLAVGYAPYGTEAPKPDSGPPVGRGRPLRLAWVGRMEEPQKRVSDLVPLLRRCAEMGAELTCDVVGDGPEAASVKADLADLEAAGFVRFHGYLPREALYRRVYPGLDALLLTSSWETGPIVAWEAMRHGATLVSTRYIGAVEEGALTHEENCLLAPVGDVEGLAQAVVRLQENGLREKLGRAARRIADERYSLEASADAWHAELVSAMEAPRKAREIGPKPKRSRSRLDRWFGPALAESLREWTGRVESVSCDPGDEWPHELHEKTVSVEEIQRRLTLILGGKGEGGAPDDDQPAGDDLG